MEGLESLTKTGGNDLMLWEIFFLDFKQENCRKLEQT